MPRNRKAEERIWNNTTNWGNWWFSVKWLYWEVLNDEWLSVLATPTIHARHLTKSFLGFFSLMFLCLFSLSHDSLSGLSFSKKWHFVLIRFPFINGRTLMVGCLQLSGCNEKQCHGNHIPKGCTLYYQTMFIIAEDRQCSSLRRVYNGYIKSSAKGDIDQSWKKSLLFVIKVNSIVFQSPYSKRSMCWTVNKFYKVTKDNFRWCVSG